MEGVMPEQLHVWLDRPLRRPEESYLPKTTKVVRCRNEQAHAPSYRWKLTATRGRKYHRSSAQRIAQFEDAVVRQVIDANATDISATFRKLATEWLTEPSNDCAVGAW